jgi:hypothetical protein
MENEENPHPERPFEVNGAEGGYLFGFDMEEFENVENPPEDDEED